MAAGSSLELCCFLHVLVWKASAAARFESERIRWLPDVPALTRKI